MKSLAAPQLRSWQAGCKSWPYYMLLTGGRAQTCFIGLGDNDVSMGGLRGTLRGLRTPPFSLKFCIFLKNVSKIK